MCFNLDVFYVKKDTKERYVFNRRGWAGASEGRVICKYFTNLGGSNLFYMQLGEGHSFLARKKLLHVG